MTVDSILEAVDLVVSESGVDGLRIRTVAARAGVGPASIYEYFETRQDLIAAWEQRTYRRLIGRFLEFVADHQARKPTLDVTIREGVALAFHILVSHFSLYRDPAEVASRVTDRIRAADGISSTLAAALRGSTQAARLRPVDLDRPLTVVVSVVTQTAMLMPAYSSAPAERERWAAELGEMIARYLLVDPAPEP